jgi:hypothetical protein
MCATAGPLASISASDAVQTRLGAHAIRDGAPTPDTAERLYDHQDFMLGADAFLNRFDGASIHAIRRGCAASASRTTRSSCCTHRNARLRAYGRCIS